jgi:uncharacterized protein YbjT (DUF2867 family)
VKVLVAGATGAVGRHAVPLLIAAGHHVRALSRNPGRFPDVASLELHTADITQPESLRGACSGIDAVIACAGASLKLGSLTQRAGFHAVDYHGNCNLLAEARRAGVTRFVFVSLAGANPLESTEYVQAHEMFAGELAVSGLPFTIIRPTGFFSMFAGFLGMARLGIVPIVGAGVARTNPIHEAEVAQACVEALSRPDVPRAIGGPEIFTRHRLAEMAFDAIGKPPRLLSIPPALVRLAVPLWGPLNPRLAALLDFGLKVTQADVVAPRYGTRRLGDYLRSVTGSAESGRSSLRQ